MFLILIKAVSVENENAKSSNIEAESSNFV